MLTLTTLPLLLAAALIPFVTTSPLRTTPSLDHTAATQSMAVCGDSWIFMSMFEHPDFGGAWHVVCVQPGTCHNVPDGLNDRISSVGVFGSRGTEYCQLYEHAACNDILKMIFVYRPGIANFKHLERLDNKVSSYRCFG